MKTKKLLALLLALTLAAGLLPMGAAADGSAAVSVNGTAATPVTGSSYAFPVYCARLDAGASSFSLDVPNEWYIRAEMYGHVYSYMTQEAFDALENAPWYSNHDYMAAADSCEVDFPLTDESVAEWLSGSGYASGDEYIEANYGSFDAFMDVYWSPAWFGCALWAAKSYTETSIPANIRIITPTWTGRR